jgi:predicted nucleic acid-binding protein
MIRVVLDPNVILSSLLQPLGPPAKVMYFARQFKKSDSLCQLPDGK